MTYYLGDAESTNFILEVKNITFHVHWEVLSSAILYFKKMRDCNMTEAVQNRAKFDDDPEMWHELLRRVYPPNKRLTLEKAAFVLPLVSYLRIDFLMQEIMEVGSENSSYRTPTFADVFCRYDLPQVPTQWFREGSDWSYANARRFVDESNSVEVVRAASALFVGALQEMVTTDPKNGKTVLDALKKKWAPVFSVV
jgi:hypothetical protein